MINKAMEFIFKITSLITPLVFLLTIICIIQLHIYISVLLIVLQILLIVVVLLIINFAKHNLETFSLYNVNIIKTICCYNLILMLFGYKFYKIKISNKYFILITNKNRISKIMNVVKFTDNILIQI